MDWWEAIKPARGGVTIEMEVVPGSRESRFPAGFNAWRGRIEAKVRAPPEDRQANAELCGLVAAALRVPPSVVRIASGQASRRKSLAVAGVTQEEARARLEALMAT